MNLFIFSCYSLLLTILLLSTERRKFNFICIFCCFFFFIGIVVPYFEITTDGLLIFPDEDTYVNNESNFLFSLLVRPVFEVFGPYGVRAINITFFFASVVLVLRSYVHLISAMRGLNRLFLGGLICVVSALSTFWAYFVLKEVLLFFGLVLLFIPVMGSQWKKNGIRLLGVGVLIIARVELLLPLAISWFLSKRSLSYREKIIYGFIGFLTALIVLYQLWDMEYFYDLRAGWLARRIDETSKLYDKIVWDTAALPPAEFLRSDPYCQNIVSNLRRIFDPSKDFTVFSAFQKSILLFSVFVAFVRARRLRSSLSIFCVLCVLMFVLTHGVYRYLYMPLLLQVLVFFVGRGNGNCGSSRV